VLGTTEVETSQEVMLTALAQSLTFLAGAPNSDMHGGFDTEDMSQWLWGLRHRVEFDSLLAGFLGDNPMFAIIGKVFSITTDTIALDDDIPSDDPRSGLPSFPRSGDLFSVDAASPGFSGTKFTYGSGPVFRMVISLKDGKVTGRNVVPGGQSALTDSPFFADQAKLWLGNDTLPMRFHVDDVVSGAVGRESYTPKP